ncbi:MAG: hydantoinase/oxoprolinase family protein [Rhodobacterales bacterium]
MGGTSNNLALVADGARTVDTRGEIDGPLVRVPIVEMHTIGAGGGFIAVVDASGRPSCWTNKSARALIVSKHLHSGRSAAERTAATTDLAHSGLDRRGDHPVRLRTADHQ